MEILLIGYFASYVCSVIILESSKTDVPEYVKIKKVLKSILKSFILQISQRKYRKNIFNNTTKKLMEHR